MIIKVGVKVAGDDEFMRCDSGKRKKRIKFHQQKNRQRLGEGGRRRRTIDIEYRYFE